MNTSYFAGIGARATPQDTLLEMYNIGAELAKQGYILRSGGAIGADQTFQDGVESVKGHADVYLAKHANEAAEAIAAEYHPAWERCNSFVRKLHARNAMILLGVHLRDPVDFVVCWTPGGMVTGGTGQSMRMAVGLGIEIVNLAVNQWVQPERVVHPHSRGKLRLV
jgi:hypothetical protein